MNLLSANDFDALSNALQRGEEIYLWRSLGDVIVRARTLKVSAPWQVDMILQIQMERGNISWTQNFINTADAKKQMDGWNKMFHWIV